MLRLHFLAAVIVTAGSFAAVSAAITVTSLPADCFARLQNDQGAFVGQVRGDCVTVTSPSSVDGQRLCLATNPALPLSTRFPVAAVVQRHTDPNNSNAALFDRPVVATLSSTTPGNGVTDGQVDGTKWQLLCTRLTSAGTYCPAGLLADWRTSTATWQPQCNTPADATALIGVQSLVSQLYNFDGPVQLLFDGQLGDAADDTADIVIQANQPLPTTDSVRVVDQYGETVDYVDFVVSVALVDAQTGQLAASVATAITQLGVAQFTTVRAPQQAGVYQLVAHAPLLYAVRTTRRVRVVAGQVAALKFTQQPAGAVQGRPLLDQPAVSAVDQFGNVVADLAAGTVHLTVAPSANSINVTLASNAGSRNTTMVGGVARFGAVSCNGTGLNVRLVASAVVLNNTKVINATSDPFNVVVSSGTAVSLRIDQQPGWGVRQQPLDPQPVLAVVDGDGNVVPLHRAVITASLLSTPASIISSSVSAVAYAGPSGTAPFTDLAVDRTVNSAVTLKFSSPGLGSVQSDPIQVGGLAAMAISSTYPSPVVAGRAFAVSVELRDSYGQPLYDYYGTVAVYLRPETSDGSPATDSLLTGSLVMDTDFGYVTYTDLRVSAAGAGYVLVFASADGVTAESAPFDVVPPPPVVVPSSTKYSSTCTSSTLAAASSTLDHRPVTSSGGGSSATPSALPTMMGNPQRLLDSTESAAVGGTTVAFVLVLALVVLVLLRQYRQADHAHRRLQ